LWGEAALAAVAAQEKLTQRNGEGAYGTMHQLAADDPESIIGLIAKAAMARQPGLVDILDEIPTAVYLTDCRGVVTHFNRACVDFAGREPAVNRDKWCVTWKLYSNDGTALPHEECPMATAIRERRNVRGMTAIAERPDGSRVSFMPYPTPLLDHQKMLVGGINLLRRLPEAA
jgi:PAS domain-containing protein